MLSYEQKSDIRSAYHAGKLKTRSVTPKGDVKWMSITCVSRTKIPHWSDIQFIRLSSEQGSSVLTDDHKVFVSPTQKLSAADVSTNTPVQSLGGSTVVRSSRTVPRPYMYDLTVSGWHNFQLENSGIVVSNSPDRFYRWRPPVSVDTVGKYSKVFGHIWLEEELNEYLDMAVDVVNLYPPATDAEHATLETMIQVRPAWRSLLIWQGQVQAARALQANWIADEFDYSIGGVSLSVDKSSKYDGLASAAQQQFESAVEAAKRTVKYIRGLQQPRFNTGFRGAHLGPNVSQGIQHPRNWASWT